MNNYWTRTLEQCLFQPSVSLRQFCAFRIVLGVINRVFWSHKMSLGTSESKGNTLVLEPECFRSAVTKHSVKHKNQKILIWVWLCACVKRVTAAVVNAGSVSVCAQRTNPKDRGREWQRDGVIWIESCITVELNRNSLIDVWSGFYRACYIL